MLPRKFFLSMANEQTVYTEYNTLKGVFFRGLFSSNEKEMFLRFGKVQEGCPGRKKFGVGLKVRLAQAAFNGKFY